MSDIKHQVIDILGKDCRVSLEQIAAMLGVSVEEVAEAIDEMEKDKIILKYSPIIDWDRAEKTRVEAMIEVKVTPQRDKGFDAVAKRISGYDEVMSVYLMSGAYDLLVLVEAPTLRELAYFVSEKLSTLDTVTATSTSFVLKRYKQDGVMFGVVSEDKRLVVSP